MLHILHWLIIVLICGIIAPDNLLVILSISAYTLLVWGLLVYRVYKWLNSLSKEDGCYGK